MKKKNISKKAIILGIFVFFIGVNALQLMNTTVEADISQGLIGYWSFNNGNANDESGNDHDGTVYGATAVAGKFGNAFSFDGDDDYIDLGDNSAFDITSSITISLWFKTGTSQMGCIVSKLDQVNPDNGYDLAMGDSFSTNPSGKITFRVASQSIGPGEYDSSQTTSTYTDNTWHLLTAIYTPNGVSRPKIYIDAVEQSVSNSGVPLSSIGTSPVFHLKLAEYSPGSGVFNFNGVLDEVRLYNRALTADEIQNLFNPPSLVGYWNFDEGSGYVLHDSSEYGYDGIINGATWTIGISGGALSFDGINDFVQFSSPVLNIPPYTVCAWVKVTSLPTVSSYVINNGGETQTSYGFYLNLEPRNPLAFEFGTINPGGNQKQRSYYTASTGVWYFLVGTWDGSIGSNHLKLYVNGSLLGNYIIDSRYSGSANNLRMGAPSDELNYFYHGILDEVRIYNRVLTYDEIMDLADIVNQPPTADAGGPYYANVNNAITFDASGSSDSDGTIVGYRWDWTNDGTYDTDWLTSSTTIHSYSSAGTYTVKLEVKDDDGATDTDITTATVTSEGGAVPTAEANGPYSGYVNHPVSFSSAGSVGGSEGFITSWYWTFGDGLVSSQQNPTHIYTSSGTFTVTLKVTNNYGQTDTDTTTATISDISPDQSPPVADAGGPYTGVVGKPITFNGSGSNDSDGTIVSYIWNFGDSTTGTGVTPTHTYTIPGDYSVVLTVTDNESLTHSNSTIATINVSGPPTIIISVDLSNIEPIEEENEKTFAVTVQCEHQPVRNIHLEILEQSNLTIMSLPSNISLNPGESREVFVTIKAPKLTVNDSQVTMGDETIILRAVGDGNITSNTEQVNFKVIKTDETPGFEAIAAFAAVGSAGALMTFFRRRHRNR